eukprot:COSAG01_NODE_1322_length_10736_cov_26.418257_2_plen_106_part_00
MVDVDRDGRPPASQRLHQLVAGSCVVGAVVDGVQADEVTADEDAPLQEGQQEEQRQESEETGQGAAPSRDDAAHPAISAILIAILLRGLELLILSRLPVCLSVQQ